ncbi:aminodeoxychorismate/anthranilate synthase component II [Helicobacter mehlei]|uniref:Aminodeoxychorismate/anthranilate synthase component II n=1 Tax=Helicobacter mehlei TaxID=2316080 RepID=A0A553V3D9_9HELI|nr:aminodeoxychorismate/anthranilate synthase component II [Helicobacter mehlei]TSA86952.1 aminodeoxychorismate/anthranilate synthase component II [Helicobacter mehlei]
MKIYLIDNFDSFTYNLVYELESLGHSVVVYRNDLAEGLLFERMVKEKQKPLLLISPGPGDPAHSGRLLPLIAQVRGHFGILGVCLGLQALAQSYGADIVQSPEIMHGKSVRILLEPFEPFEGLGESLQVGRYHSLVASNLPPCLKVIAHYEGMVMGLYCAKDNALAYQFHPESIMSTQGTRLLKQSLEFLQKNSHD